MSALTKKDARFVWHPYTQHGRNAPVLAVTSAKGAFLETENGARYLDAISSWWVNIHGHGRSEIAEAIHRQALALDHVHFAGVTHAPAADLAERLVRLSGLGTGSRVFFSDDGSTAVEAALKICHQYWENHGEKRPRVLVFRGGYHGDTVGAMSAGKSSGFFQSFQSWLFHVDALEPPPLWWGHDAREAEERALAKLDSLLRRKSNGFCALLVEPLIQGAGGMRVHSARFLKRVCQTVKKFGIPVIFDEVMTGFYRTGTLFAFQQTGFRPDLLCLSKALTGGVLPLGATVVRKHLFDAFLGPDFSRALAHGHSFTGNAISCAAALASLDILEKENARERVAALAEGLAARLAALARDCNIIHPRALGAIAAFDLPDHSPNYTHNSAEPIRRRALEQGLLIRPMGNVIYIMPPYCVTSTQLDFIFDTLRRCLP